MEPAELVVVTTAPAIPAPPVGTKVEYVEPAELVVVMKEPPTAEAEVV